MIHLRKLVSVACWALLLTSYSGSTNSENIDPTTGNLINFTGTPTATTGNWVNGVYVKSLTCWQPGDPGNCGPYPNVQTNGNINFSYGQVDLNQVININKALSQVGNNLQVTGFNFGFRAKNGNGWDNGQQDYLAAYVNFLKSNGSVALHYDYTQYTNRKYDWTNFNFSETFSNPSLATGYRAAQVGFIGKDTNNWAGPYGPEITNVSFNLKYRVDPCATDPTSSPTCPGFMAAMNAKSSNTTSNTTSVESPQSINVSASAKSQVDSTPITKNTVPAKSLSIALSTIAKNQQREQIIQSTAVQTAIAEASSASEQAQQQAVSIATSSAISSQQTFNTTPVTSLNSVNKSAALVTSQIITPKVSVPNTTNTSSVTNIGSTNTQPTETFSTPSYSMKPQSVSVQETSITLPQLTTNNKVTNITTQPVTSAATSVVMQNTSIFSQVDTESQPANIVTSYIQPQDIMFYSMVAVTEQQQLQTLQPITLNKQIEVEQANNNSSFMTNRTDPLNEIIEAKMALMNSSNTEQTQTVKTNVAANELAGGVDISKLATTPAGYGTYINLTLKDGTLYEPKEIYKNQAPVDNARALRQLSTDRLHQQMMEQQYRR